MKYKTLFSAILGPKSDKIGPMEKRYKLVWVAPKEKAVAY